MEIKTNWRYDDEVKPDDLNRIEGNARELERTLGYYQNYETPQMYGAVGDGKTDDTKAVRECIKNNKVIFFPSGTYLVSEKLVLNNVKLIGESKLNTEILFKDCDGIGIVNRGVILEEITISQSNHFNHIGINFDKHGDNDTVTECIFRNIRVLYFEYGLRSVDAACWSCTFDNLNTTGNKNGLYFDRFTNNLSASIFCNIFINHRGDSRNGGYLLYLRGAYCVFYNSNYSANFVPCVYISSSAVTFNGSSFETDIATASVGSIMNFDGNIIFDNCRFVHNFSTDGNNYFMTTINKANKSRIEIKNCSTVSYTNSKLKSVTSPTFGESTEYGCVIDSNNDFSIFETNYNNFKSYIVRPSSVITLFAGYVEKNKLKINTMYAYKKADNSITMCYFNSAMLIGFDGAVLENFS